MALNILRPGAGAVPAAELPDDPEVRDLVARLPLPGVILRRDGRVAFANAAAARGVAGAWLAQTAPVLLGLAERDEPAPLLLTDPAGARRPVTAHAAWLRGQIIAVFDEPDHHRGSLEVAGLRRRIVELERLVAVDALTALWNRGHFDRVIPREASFSERERSPLSLAIADVDFFKNLNSRHGRTAGNAVLRNLASMLKSAVRPSDLLFRWGGDRFAIVMPATSASAARAVAERLCRGIAAGSWPLVGRVTVSIAVAEHDAGEGLDHWFERVDRALHEAKRAGRNRVAVAPGGSSGLWLAQRGGSALRLVWSEELVSGHAVIDEQHRALFDAVNTILGMLSGEQVDLPALLDRLDCLVSAIARHFRDEEEVMAAVRYPDLETHRRLHHRLLEGARRLRGTLQTDEGAAGRLVEFLAFDVVNRHILKADRQFYPYVASAAEAS